jgi:putative two-component system response regulator
MSVRRRVLVVDDQPTNLRLVADILGPEYDVLFATTARRALEIAAARPPDLVLLDVHLPDGHGYDVCRRLKADPRTGHAPVLFLTASDDPAREEERRAAGSAETLTKPVDPARLRSRVAAHLQEPPAR